MNSGLWKKIAAPITVVLGLYVVGYLFLWQWMVCRVYVEPNASLRLTYKGPFLPFLGSVQKADPGTLVQVDSSGRPLKIGVLEMMPGPGRHFYSPLEYDWERVPDVVIEPGMIGQVSSNVGKELPAGATLADEGYRGIQRKVLTPGRYRINPYAYKVEIVPVSACVGADGGVKAKPGDATLIPPGYVGVVTNKVAVDGSRQGVLADVLQPGIYFINPAEKRVDIVSIGYNETTLKVETVRNADGTAATRSRMGKVDDDADLTQTDPVYVEGKGIEFPSNDGFRIHMDYTVIWGILPFQAPDVVKNFGDLKTVEQTVILPQVESICRSHGSMRKAVELLVGDTREAFQTDTAEELEKRLESANLTLLFGLTRHLYVPVEIREPIQKANIADELKLTRDQEQNTTKAQAELTKAKTEVVSQEQLTSAETENKVAQLKALGGKESSETEAETGKLKAKLDAETAKIDAQITLIMGEAAAKRIEYTNQAKAEKFKQYVQALGGPDAYNRYVFADKLSDDMKLGVFYAGPGTFWTDLKGFEQVMLGKLAAEGQATRAIPATSRSGADAK